MGLTETIKDCMTLLDKKDAEIERLREALEKIANMYAEPCVYEIATKALESGGE